MSKPQEIALTEAAIEIIAAGRKLHAAGWVPATSGNFSTRISDHEIAITVSGSDKGRLSDGDVMPVDLHGHSSTNKKASAELELHLQLYRRDPHIGAVLHTHSVNATLVSQHVSDACEFRGLELLKAFNGISSHDAVVRIPVFDNTQDMPSLSDSVEKMMQSAGQGYGYLIRGHGLYSWGKTMTECMRHLEALEFLLDYNWRSMGIQQTKGDIR